MPFNSTVQQATGTPTTTSSANLSQALTETGKQFFSIPGFLIEKGSQIGWSLITAFLTLIIGFWIASFVKKIIQKRMIARDVDLSVRSFVLPIIDILLKIVVIIPVIARLGLNVTGFLAALSGVGLAIGLALQGSLSNFAGGLLIILFKPFKVGDYIVSQGNEGTVESISILYTVLVTDKGQVITLPNANLFNNPVTNYSVKDWRRLDFTLRMAYTEDFEKVKKVILDVLNAEPMVDQEKSKLVEIGEFTTTSINLTVRAFVKRKDYLQSYWKLYRDLKVAFDKNNIEIPHIKNQIILTTADSVQKK
ncbi:MAG: mechanosensitive ion channel family protein [Bergeyella sp.]|nr:mechanosensitive ion channel family protein [Bergeyella sp.]